MAKNVYERFADRIAATPGYVALAAAPPPDFPDFAWLEGDWAWTMHIHATPATAARTATGEFTHLCKGPSVWIRTANMDPLPYFTYDPFNRQWVLSMTNRTSYGIMTSPGWRDGIIVFEGDMTFMGVPMRLRQSIQRKSNDETLSVNEEWLDGAWVQVDHIVTRRQAKAHGKGH